MNIKNILTSFIVPPAASEEHGINSFRQRLLHYLLLSFAIFGSIAYIPSIYFAVQHELYSVVVLDKITIGF